MNKLKYDHPSRCPVTGEPFFMMIKDDETETELPTYGGPYNSYTLPEWDCDDQAWYRRNYDHDDGAWKDGVEFVDAPPLIVAQSPITSSGTR